MIDPIRQPRLARGLYLFDRIKGFLLRGKSHKPEADKNLARFYEKVWRDAAAQVNASIESLGHDIFEIRRAAFRTRVIQNVTAIDDLVIHCLVRTKPAVYDLLEKHALPVPRHLGFTLDRLEEAGRFLAQSTAHCVVKPATGTGGGLGVTAGIRSRWQLARAAFAAARHSDDLLIEEEVQGDNYRLLYLDGELVDAVIRHPPTVVGDGTSTVHQLVRAANAIRVAHGADVSHVLLTVDMDMQRALARQRLTLASVPAQGALVAVKTVINQNCGADNLTVVPLLCPSVIEAGAKAARVTGVRLAGVDVITPDPGAPLVEAGGVILEVNSPPGYYWHYHKRDGSFPVALHVLQRLLTDRQGGGEDMLQVASDGAAPALHSNGRAAVSGQ